MPPIGHMDWIGFRKLDPHPTLAYSALLCYNIASNV